WLAVANRDPALFARAETELTDLLLKHNAAAEERARVVLLLAESSAALSRTPKSYDVLQRIAEQLVRRGGPPGLRLRAAIDAASVWSRRGRVQEAEQLLRATLADLDGGAQARAEGDLYALARAYAVVINAKSGDVKQWRKAQRELGVQGIAPSNVIAVWQNLWREEFATREREQRCGPVAICRQQQRAALQKQTARISAGLSPHVARLMPAALGASSLSLGLQYAPLTGLTPTVAFDPVLLSIEFPGP
ncbi:MAG TPA: hypothetical protein VK524_24610, partial [Polyangiaceae bacterium]|nr:hypothetical protein [Polyangiaceae bacterium]